MLRQYGRGLSAGEVGDRVDEEIEAGLCVDGRQHLAVRRLTREDMALVDDGHAPGELTACLDRNVAVDSTEQLRVGECEDGEWVVNGSTPDRTGVVARQIVVAEEAEEVGEDGGERAGKCRDPIDALRRRLELVRDVEARHHETAAVAEHDRSGFRVGPDVEFAGRRAIAERAASHQRDAGDAFGDVGRRSQGQRDVGQWADRYEPEVVGGSAGVDDERDGVGAVERGRRSREVGAVEAALAVDERTGVRLGDERAGAPRVNRDIEPEKITHHAGVVGGALEGCVAGDRGDPDQLCVTGGRHDRHRIVVAGVAVEENPWSVGFVGHGAEHGSSAATLSFMVPARNPVVVRRALLAGCLLAMGCSGSDGISTAPHASPSSPPSTPPAAVESTAPDAVPATTGSPTVTADATVPDDPVPGLDSDDPFCRAWSEFAGSFQALALASSVGVEPENAIRLEVAASGAVMRAAAHLDASLPVEVADERDTFVDVLLGPFTGRARAARESLITAGLTQERVDGLADLWLATLSEARSQDPDLVFDVPPEDQPAFDDAVASFSAAVVPIDEDPSLVTDADVPQTLAYIAGACPDRGILAGNDTIGD